MLKKKKDVNNFELSSKQYCKEIAGFSPLTKEEEMELIRDYKKNHNLQSRDKLIQANLKFVVNIAKKYYGRGLSYADLIAEGNMGLIKGIERFDETKDCKTITYSVWWIKQSILEAIDKRNGVEHDELPMDTEAHYYSDDDAAEPIIGDEFKDGSIENILENEDLKNVISLLTANLTPKEYEVINMYYGLDGGEPKTLEEIGSEIGLTKERIRQIKDRSHKKMRASALENCITEDIYR